MAGTKGDDPDDKLRRILAHIPDPDSEIPPAPKPDWRKWGAMIEATVQDTVALSCDMAPEVFQGGIADGPQLREFFQRQDITANHVQSGRLQMRLRQTFHGMREFLVLTEFATWAEAPPIGWRLPPLFPRAPKPKPELTQAIFVPTTIRSEPSVPPDVPGRIVTSSPDPSAATADPAPGGGPTIQLPHMTRTLSALFEIMRKHWTNYDPKKPPKQSHIALEIGEALGFTPSKDGGKPSRDADTLAAAIRPDEIADADSRARGRRGKP